MPAFSIDELLNILNTWPPAGRYHVAYSGGLDSHVLLFSLHALRSELPGELCAIHVNHNLNERAGEWAEHCRRICDKLGIKLDVIEIEAGAPKGESQEAWARKMRYNAMGKRIKTNEMLLTAHNRDDQAETLLLQLMRGSGPAGLAAMPAFCPFGAGWHGRPLLNYGRKELHDYAAAGGLTWIEDDSNLDRRFDRNFIRHEVLPGLRERWPSVTETLARAARLQVQSADLLEELAAQDLDACLADEMEALNIRRLKKLSLARRANLLRHWIKRSGLPGPDSRQLQQILTDVLEARAAANPCVSWPGAEVRRYQDRIFVMQPLPEAGGGTRINWKLDEPCRLPLGYLRARRGRGEGLRAGACPDGVLQVGFRAGGEVIRREGSQHHQQLKKLFQEYAIPPWLREYVPLLYIGDELAAVAGQWIAGEFAAAPEEESWQVTWTVSTESSAEARAVAGNKYISPAAPDKQTVSLQLLYEKWLRKDEWLLKAEALPLLLGIDPYDRAAAEGDEIEKYWREMVSAVRAGQLSPVTDSHLVESSWRAAVADIYSWALNTGVPMPEPLTQLMNFVLKTIKRETTE